MCVAMAPTFFICREILFFEGTIVEIFLFVLMILGSLLAERDLVRSVSFSKHLHSSRGMSGQRLRECLLIQPWGSCGLLICPAS